MSSLVLHAVVVVAAAILTRLHISLASRLRWLDRPVERSSHSFPTPVSGGLSIVLLVLGLASWYYLSGLLPRSHYLSLGGPVLVALLGLADDIRNLGLRWRVCGHLLAAGWVLYWLGGAPPLDLGFALLPGGWVLNGIVLLALVWLLNLYNFMDGIDGLAASELIFVTSMSLFFVINTDANSVLLLSALLAATAGFLLWNWPPARIFMGDAGSGFLGLSLGVMALWSIQAGALTPWTWLILLAVFAVDATITLSRRVLAGEKWYQGHACHAYQHAARRYKSHGKVTITVMVVNIAWLAPLAWLSVRFPHQGLYLCLLAIAPLCLAAVKFGAGRPAAETASTG